MVPPGGGPTRGRRVLVVDPVGSFHAWSEKALGPLGYEVLRRTDARATTDVLEEEGAHAILVDVCIPGDGMLEGVESVLRAGTGCRTVIITGCPIMDAAARVLYPGADEFLQKPCTTDELRRLVSGPTVESPAPATSPAPVHGIVGRSPAIRDVIEKIHRVAPTRATVLVVGETGTGKELVAAAVHECSPRSAKPYVIVDAAALPETLLERELFGHTRGAFTGATEDKPGLFEAADGGTLFLDEIGDVPDSVQVRLLRAVQEGQVRRIGAVEPVRVDVRVVAATQRDPEEAVRSGTLRPDLYYRLSEYTIGIPPLRERLEDIEPLVHYALSARGPLGPGDAHCSELAVRMLQAYTWPGNVRELLSVLRSARIDAEGARISATDLPERIREAWREEVLGGPAPDEREAIVQALDETDGHRARAARLLGVNRTTLWRWMAGHDL